MLFGIDAGWGDVSRDTLRAINPIDALLLILTGGGPGAGRRIAPIGAAAAASADEAASSSNIRAGCGRTPMNAYLLMMTFRVWVVELPVAAFNYFVLIRRVYAPRVGELRAHQIGMSTRIAWIAVFAYFLDRFGHADSIGDYVLAGTFWVVLWLAFEWIGSLITRRPVHEILEGWHIENGYMWPYVLLAYLLSPLIVGLLLNPAA